jgi:asparagine synthase (glutamine-hydrolysing)
VKNALYAPAARERSIFRKEYVDRLLDEPNDHSTRLGSNKLWQVALLELWLQSQGI